MRAGLACILKIKCVKCNREFSLPSSSRTPVGKSKKIWSVNVGAVLSQMATGGRAARLQQVMATVGTPSMSKPTFISAERYIMTELKSLLTQTMLEAGEIKKQNAISLNNFFKEYPLLK